MYPLLLDWSGFQIFSYPLFVGMAWGIGYQLSIRSIDFYEIPRQGFRSLFWGTFLFSWIGAKVLFLITQSLMPIGNLASHSNFWLGGGFVFYGGLIGGMIYSLLHSILIKSFDVKLLFIFLPSLSIAHAIGRLGCFLAGCCYGTYCNLPWAVNLHEALRHPVQLYESTSLFSLGFILLKGQKKKWTPLSQCSVYLGGYALIRFSLEFLRGDKIRGVLFAGLSTSQLISLFFIFGVSVYFLKSKLTRS